MPTGDAPTASHAPLSSKQVGFSLRWTFATTAATGVVQLALAAVLARLLSPADYGIVGVAAGVLRFLQYFADFGIVSTVIQKRDLDHARDVPILFALAAGANLVLLGVVWVGAPLLAAVVPNLSADTVAVLRGLAFAGLIGGAGQTAIALMRRNLDFRAIGIQGFVALAVGQGAVAIPLAAAGFGPWSLVGGAIAQVAVAAALALWSVRPVLRPRSTTRVRLRALATLGSGYLILRILDSTGLHLLPVVVGVLAGMDAVGLWDRAFILAMLPLEALCAGAGQILFPVYSRLAGEPERLRKAWLSVILLGPCLLGGVAGGMAAAAPQIVSVMLGPAWLGAVQPLAWLSAWALLRMLAMLTGTLCEALGRLTLRGAHQVAYLAAQGCALAVVRPVDLVGILQVLLAVEVVAQSVMLLLAAGACGAPRGEAARNVLTALLPGILVGGGTAAVTAAWAASGLPPLAGLVAAMAASGLLLAIGVLLHPSRALRRAVGQRLLGDALGITAEGRTPAAAARRWLER
ncbi:oligosaccharide flippase family protein [Azospirillum sp. sgz301742]